MEGLILFADDEIFKDSFERKLFEFIKQNSEHPILPINNLNDFEKAIKSISTFRAILLDWEFIEELEDGAKSTKDPLAILLSNPLYSLIFIYSQKNIGDEAKKQLSDKFPGKIEYLSKIKDNSQLESETEKIFASIKSFQDANKHLSVPFIWSHAINKAVQTIFDELEKADKFWIKDLYYSSFVFDKKGAPMMPPPVDPNVQVINLFQNLLAEQLIQNTNLQQSIEKFSEEYFKNISDDIALQNLYKRLYYTTTLESDTVMTGDVYELTEYNFGIVISPECDINTLIKKNQKVEMLCFHQDDFEKKIKSILNVADEPEKISRAYNQENPRIHLLPVFPANKKMITALIDFRFCLQHHDGAFLEGNKNLRQFKINSPYIQQLRQRYLSYIGRVGVPSIPISLRITK